MTAHRTRRAGAAILALLAGWVVGSAAVFAFEGLLAGGSRRIPDMLWFAGLIGLFAGAGWLVSVLPLALFVDHRRWFFRPATAPLVGAACGWLLLLLESWIFFGVAPWSYLSEPVRSSDLYLMAVAALIGAVIWATYTASVRPWRVSGPAEAGD